MKIAIFLLGVLTFPSGMMYIYNYYSNSESSLNFFLIYPFLIILLSLGFLASILFSVFNGWSEKELKAVTKMSLALLVIKTIFIVIVGHNNFLGELIGMPGANSTSIGLVLLAWLGLNIAANFFYPNKPTKWVLGLWFGLNIAIGLGMVFLVGQNNFMPFGATVVMVFSRMFLLGILLLLTFRHYSLRKKWDAYLAKGNITLLEDLLPVTVITDEKRIERLSHLQLVVRVAAADTLRYSENPEAIPALARAVEGAPFLYFLEETKVASGWKALKKVARDSLQTLQGKNQPFLDSFPHVYCNRDHRWAIKEETPGGTEYVLCPQCRKHDALSTGIQKVVGLIGHPEDIKMQDGTLAIPVWDNASQSILPAEISELAIYPETPGLQADWAVSAFIQHFQNDIRNEGRKIPIHVEQPALLAPNTLALLKGIEKESHADEP